MAQHERVPGMAEAIEERRRQLGITPTQFAELTGLTPTGLAPLRRGERRRYQERLTGPVTRVLGWTPDSIERLLRGDDPKLADANEDYLSRLRTPFFDRSSDHDMDVLRVLRFLAIRTEDDDDPIVVAALSIFDWYAEAYRKAKEFDLAGEIERQASELRSSAVRAHERRRAAVGFTEFELQGVISSRRPATGDDGPSSAGARH